MELYLAVSPTDAAAAVRGPTPAHVAYRIGENSSLLALPLPAHLRGGLMSLSDYHAPPVEQPSLLVQAVVRECSLRSYSGVLLDMEETPRPDLLAAARQLSQTLLRQRKQLFVPSALSASLPQAVSLFCTAISGGDLRQHLLEQIQRRKGGLWALDLQRLRMDFPLPCPSGEGQPLTGHRLAALRQEFPCPAQFSPELGCKTFPYVRDGQWHLVLFDDLDTLRRKLQLASELHCPAAFFMWPEISDLAPQLFS